MLLFPADRGSHVRSVDDAVHFAIEGARRAFDLGLEEMACHLVAHPYRDVGNDGYGVITIITPDAVDLPMPTVRAARGVAAAIECEAAIWVVPGYSRADAMRLYVERADATEETYIARPDSQRDYILGPFGRDERREIYELSYVALPPNVIAYAERFGLYDEGDDAPFGPSAFELERARAASETFARPCGRRGAADAARGVCEGEE